MNCCHLRKIQNTSKTCLPRFDIWRTLTFIDDKLICPAEQTIFGQNNFLTQISTVDETGCKLRTEDAQPKVYRTTSHFLCLQLPELNNILEAFLKRSRK